MALVESTAQTSEDKPSKETIIKREVVVELEILGRPLMLCMDSKGKHSLVYEDRADALGNPVMSLAQVEADLDGVNMLRIGPRNYAQDYEGSEYGLDDDTEGLVSVWNVLDALLENLGEAHRRLRTSRGMINSAPIE